MLLPFENGFPIAELILPWGSTLLDVAAHTTGREWHRVEGEPSLRGACRSVFGVAATECYLRAPAQNKPILRVHYQLAPTPPHLSGAATLAHWLAPLNALLGPPDAPAASTEQLRPERGALLFRATWPQRWQHVSMLVYRAIQPETGGPTATLALEWQDVLTAAQPYLMAHQAQETLLNAAANRPLAPQLFELKEAQLRQGPHPTVDLTASEILFRQAQWALHHNGMYQTPHVLGRQLGERQAALWPTDAPGPWALSTKWSTVLLPTRGPGPRISLVVTHPGKGPGFRSLQVGELVLYDAYQSSVLTQLAAALELWGNATVVLFEGADY